MINKVFFGTLLLLAISPAFPGYTQTVGCVVENEESSSVSGSLGEKMGILNPPSPPDCTDHTITFADGVNNIEISSTGSITRDSAVIDGGGDVSITTGSGGLSALMIIGADNVAIQNLTAINSTTNTAFPTVITQDENMTNNTFSGVSFSSAGINIQLESGLNLVTQCNFEFTQAALSEVLGASATRPLVKINGLIAALSSPINFQARLTATDIAQWTLSGDVGAAANRVEIYTVDATAKTVNFLAATTASSGAFSFTFTMPATLPNQTFAFLGMNNTTGSFQMSQFSSAFTPTTDDAANFYTNNTACASVTWLVAAQGGLTGDFDGDGLTNGTEDADADCTVDSTETNPAASDTDGDTVADNTDNCKTTSNLSQADADSNGTGDACTDTDSDGVFDDTDNCESTANATQADADADGIGDACETASVVTGGTTTDTGATSDAGATTDAGATASTTSDSGGGCSLAPGTPASQPPAVLAMLGLLALGLLFTHCRSGLSGRTP